MKKYDVKKAGERIQVLRKTAHLTQEQLAEILSVTPKTISAMERGATGCSVDMFVDLANFFHVSLDHLIAGADAPASILTCGLDAAIDCLTRYRDEMAKTEP